MKFATSLLFAGAATAAIVPRTAPAIAVHLAPVDDTQVRATITNTGTQPLRLLKRGTILDPHPVRKLDVHADGTPPPIPARPPLTRRYRREAPLPRDPQARPPRHPRPRRLHRAARP